MERVREPAALAAAGWVGAGLFYALIGLGVLLCATMTVFALRQLYRALGAPRSASPGARSLE